MMSEKESGTLWCARDSTPKHMNVRFLDYINSYQRVVRWTQVFYGALCLF